LAKIEVGERPARFELPVDRKRLLKPALGLVRIAPQLGSQAQPDSWRRCTRIQAGDLL
jgi:hypothetical protein